MEEIIFSGCPLDPADRLRGNAEWLADKRAEPQTRFLPLWKLMAFVNVPGVNVPGVNTPAAASLVWLHGADLQDISPKAQGLGPKAMEGRTVFLGLLDDIAHFAIDMDGVGLGEAAPFGPFGHFIEARAAAGILAGRDAAILARARSIIDWHQRHGFCAKCGAATYMARGGYLRQCRAEGCLAQHFPRVDPVVIMLIVRGDKCLLGRQARFPAGMYSALAGFMEPGETIEEAVRRESLEEAGITVGEVRYMASQPWPFPSTLMIGCEAEALTEAITLDGTELEAASWHSKSDIRRVLAGDKSLGFSLPPSLAIAHHLTREWAARGIGSSTAVMG